MKASMRRQLAFSIILLIITFYIGFAWAGYDALETNKLHLKTTSGTSRITMQAPALSNSWSMTMPTSAGTADLYLKTNGSGITSWNDVTDQAANKSLSNLTSPTSVNQHLIPSTGTMELGSTTTPWNYVRTKFLELYNGSNKITIKSPSALTINKIYNLPVTDGTSGQVLQTDGSGNLSFVTAPGAGGGAPGGGTGAVQFNNASTFGGTNSFFWDNPTSKLRVGWSGVSPVATFNVNGSADAAVAQIYNYYIGGGTTTVLDLQDDRGFSSATTGKVLNINQDTTTSNTGTLISANTSVLGEIFSVKSNGKIGIGKTPTTTLDVNGIVSATQLNVQGVKTFSLTRTVPTSVNTEVDLGTISSGIINTTFNHSFLISIYAAAGGISTAKTYLFTSNYPATSLINDTWYEVLPLTSTGLYQQLDMTIDAKVTIASGLTSLRLRRTSGTTAATALINIQILDDATVTFTSSTTTASVSAPADYWPYSKLTQSANNVGIGIANPVTGLHIQGLGELISGVGSKLASLRIVDTAGLAGNGGAIEFGASGTSYFSAIKGYLTNGGSNTVGNLVFYTRNVSIDPNLTERMTVRYDGIINITNLAGAGSRAVNADASGNLSAASDSRLKQEVIDAELPGLKEVLKIEPKAYKWLSDIKQRGSKASVEIGFFADQVAPIIPSAAPMGNDGYYGFYDRSITAALVNSIKELKKENDELKKLIEKLEIKIK